MGRSIKAAFGKNVRFASANAIVRASLLRSSALNGVIKGEVVKSASLNAYTSLFVQYVLNASLNSYVSASTLVNGLISYWKLDGNSTDELAVGNGTDTAITYSAGNGKLVQGAGFNGTTSKVVLPQLAAYKPSQFTISAWVKTSVAGGYYEVFQSYNQAGTPAGFEFRMTPGNKLELVIGTGATYTTFASVLSINTGNWIHLLASYDGAMIRLYLDGVLDGSVAWAPGVAYTADTRVRIGVSNYAGATEASFWNGTIDEVAFWNRALNTLEVEEFYNVGLGQQYSFGNQQNPTYGLVGYWKLDGNSTDSVGTNNGTDTAITYSAGNGKLVQGAGGNGTTSKIDLGTANLNLLTISIACWVKLTNTSNYWMLVCRTTGGSGNYELRTEPGGAVSMLGPGGTGVSASSAPLTAGVWYHVVATRSSTGATRIYINGTLKASGTGPTPTSNPASATFIGTRGDGYSHFNGAIDEVGIWNRILVANEVQTIYNKTVGNQYPLTSVAPTTTAQTAYWKLDGNSTDSLATFNGTDTGMSYAAGKINSGAVFNGSGTNGVAIAGAPVLGTVFSVSAWINPSSLAGAYSSVVSNNSAAPIGFYVKSTSKLAFYDSGDKIISLASIPTGTWTHVVYVSTGTGGIFYINGAEDTAATWTQAAFTMSFIGRDFYAPTNSYVGSIDEVGVWTRVLTLTEILALYNAGVGIQYPY